MTTPVVTPSKMKAVIALIGALLTAVIPLLLQISTSLPPPWPALVGGVVALLTMLGVYHAPYKPADTVIVPAGQPLPAAPPAPPTAGPPPGGWQKPPGWG